MSEMAAEITDNNPWASTAPNHFDPGDITVMSGNYTVYLNKLRWKCQIILPNSDMNPW